MIREIDYTRIKRQSPKNGIVKCPACGRMAVKRSKWRMKDGSYNRLYIHKEEIKGFPVVTESCVVMEVSPTNK